MSSYIIVADRGNGHENKYINYLCNYLRSKGHHAVNGGIGPNRLQELGQRNSSRGKIGVQICNGLAGVTLSDFYVNVKSGFYKFKEMHHFGTPKMGGSSYLTDWGFNNYKILGEPGLRWTPATKKIGYLLTPKQFNKKYGSISRFCIGDKIDTCLKLLMGSGVSAGTGKSIRTYSASTYKDMIKELLAPLDGYVEIKCLGDTVYINKIKDFETFKGLRSLEEGVNVYDVNMTLWNPNTVNRLVVKSKGHKNIIVDDSYLINQYGVIKATRDAFKWTTAKGVDFKEGETDEEDSAESDSDNKKNKKNKKKKKKKKREEDEDTETNENLTKDYNKKDYNVTYKEALVFAKREYGVIQRENGHTVTLTTTETGLKIGDWVRVTLYSYNYDGYMYITKLNNSASPLKCELTLMDYPPCVSSEVKDIKTENSGG